MEPAIEISNVTKAYELNQRAGISLATLFGFSSKPTGAVETKTALNDVSLTVARGERLGIVGRNGAGKTTLLKLLTGNFAPTAGTVSVSGTVQALMTMGSGFHQDYTGMDNIKSSLHFNGLSRAEIQEAVEDIVEFCELGNYIDQPFKTYSAGMQARLMFACATAINPDILIVDEVLGVGDAYFIAKSKLRMERLITSGCTMLLVSHSMAQVLEMCDRAIWMDNGQIRKEGRCFDVIKAYEAFLFAPIQKLETEAAAKSADENHDNPAVVAGQEGQWVRDPSPFAALADEVDKMAETMQEPRFIPHAGQLDYPLADNKDHDVMAMAAPGGISPWDGSGRLKISGFSVASPRGINTKLTSLQPATMTVFVRAEETMGLSCRCGLAIHTLEGRAMLRSFSKVQHLTLKEGEGIRFDLTFNPLQLGPGVYTIGISLHGDGPLEEINNVERYDLLSRSFAIEVELPDSLTSISADFFHSAEWYCNPSVTRT